MRVSAGARIGLVDGGEVIRRRGLSVATLPQYVEGNGRTPMGVARAARPEISDLQGELEACEDRLGSPGVATDMRRMQRVLERQERLLRRFTELGGPGFEGEARGYLRLLGLDGGDIDRPMRD
jgi:ATP-binding cassette subfamily F protein 3